MSDSKFVIVDLHDGFKCEGNLINIDKEKMIIVLGNVRKFKIENNLTTQETKHNELMIPKSQIKEVKMVQTENDIVSPSVTPNQTVIKDSKTEEKKTEVNPNAIPKNLEKAKHTGHYQKNEFFDDLNTITSQDSKNETIRYNEKNAETFNITESSQDYRQKNYSNNRGGGGRGRGYKNNYNNNYNNRNNYNNQNQNQNNDFEGNQGNNSYNNNNYRGNRGKLSNLILHLYFNRKRKR